MNLYDDEPEVNQQEPVEIFSRNTILWFCILFNPVYGGVLLAQNLWMAGFKKALGGVVAFAVIYTLVSYQVLAHIPIKYDPKSVANRSIIAAISFGLNAVGGFILSRPIFSKYFPENDYYPRPIGRAVFRAIMISLIVLFLLAGRLPV